MSDVRPVDLCPRPTAANIAVRRDDYLDICQGNRTAAELLDHLVHRLGWEVGRITDPEERSHELELLAGPRPDRSGVRIRLSQEQLATRLHCSVSTISRTARLLQQLGLLRAVRAPGEAADNVYTYFVNLGRLRELVDQWQEHRSNSHRRRGRLRVIEGEAAEDDGASLFADADADLQPASPVLHPEGSPAQSENPDVQADRSSLRAGVESLSRRAEESGSEASPIDREEPENAGTEGEPTLQPLPRTQQRASNDRVRRSGMPSELHGVLLEELSGPDSSYENALSAARRLATGETKGLVIRGGPGRGKTTVAASAAWAIIGAGSPLVWLLAGEVRRLVEEAPYGAEEREAVIEALGRRCALVLDDLDELDGKRARREVGDAVASRMQRGLPVVITTERSLDHLEAELGEKVFSRLVGYCELVELRGTNLHKVIARQGVA